MSLTNLLKKGALRGLATATPATPATHLQLASPTVARVATVAVAAAKEQPVNPAAWREVASAKATDDALVQTAMRACDHFNDGPADRELMKVDCLAMPDHLKADLLAHFRKTYGLGPTTGRPVKTLAREADSEEF